MATKFITVSIEIMHDKDLTPNQKFILAEIEQLCSLEKGCIASNRHFAELIGIKVQGVSNAINDLAKKGYISIDNSKTVRNYGRNITIHENVSPIHENVSPIHENVESKGNKTINKTINNKSKPKKDDIYSFLTTDEQNTLAHRLVAQKDVISSNHISSFIKYRKRLKSPIKTLNPILAFIGEIKKINDKGYSTDEAITAMEDGEWRTIKLDWYLNSIGQKVTNKKPSNLDIGDKDYKKDGDF